MAKVKITGIRSIDRKLSKLDAKMGKKIIRKAGRESMKIVAAEAKQNAPVGETGNLKKSIKVKSGKRSRKSIELKAITDNSIAYYAPMVEFGTENIPAQGFMRRAYDSKEKEARRKAIEEIKKGLK